MIVEVLADRKSIFKTAFYQLSHASMRVNTKRSQVVTWFGTCSYRKLKVEVKEYKAVCPICQKDLMNKRYSGGKVIVVNRNSSEFKSHVFMDAVEDGVEVFSEVEGGSGSYDE
jgi:RNA polymerase subunit RPABC4/transcription elongation factor Spt4